MNHIREQRRLFVLLHWLMTLVLGPFFSQLIYMLKEQEARLMVLPLEAYPIFLIVSLVFSIPTVILNLLINHQFRRLHYSWAFTKTVVISTTVIGAIVTILLLGGGSGQSHAEAYALSALSCGLLFSWIFNSKRVPDS